ncbi:MAG: OmpA family protein [Candidatus Limnocylindrales bacterium]
MVERADRDEGPQGDEERSTLVDAGPDDEIAALTAILLDPERQHLEALQTRLDDLDVRANDIGEVLPQVLLRHAHNPTIARALTPALERAITTSVQRNPKPLADALFPIMGPAIRKAVAASLAGMVESLNRTLEHAFSRQSIQWRLEALRTGKSFAEVVLLKTLLFRVEQVLLIDRKTGLMLQHAHTSAAVQDADMVSGMLTAIRDFAQDSFRVSGDDSLESLKVGDLAVWIETGPHAILAAVIRGSAPRDFRRVLQDTLETIHLKFGEALESFSGDASTLDGCMAALEECLKAEYRSDERKSRSGLGWTVAGAVALALFVWAGLTWRSNARDARYLDALRAEPGMTIVSASRAHGKLVVTGLRDPRARDPKALLEGTGLAADGVIGYWSPYYALDPPLVLARARDVLQPPNGTTMVLNAGVLSATGTPTLAWVGEARRLAPLVPGVTSFDAVATLDASTRAVIAGIERHVVLFVKGTARLASDQEQALGDIARDVRELEALAEATGQRFRLDIKGYTDADGAAESNLPLSRARAAVIQAAISREAIERLEIVVEGLGSREPLVLSQNEMDKQQNRRVTIRVTRLGG